MKTIVVTGGLGFMGRHLLKSFSPKSEIVCMDRSRPEEARDRGFLTADLTCAESVRKAFGRLRPDVVFHLAGKTPPGGTADFYRVNTMGTINLLRALQHPGKTVRVVLVGSAAEYGPVPVTHLPVREDHSCHPEGPYALSKWFASLAGLHARPPVETLIARVFNPIGPGMSSSQAFGRIARALAVSEADSIELKVGDLEARRDFIDVRDVARALIALAERGRANTVYNVGTGQSRKVGKGLDVLKQLSGRIVTIESSKEIGARGPSDSRADIGRISSETGWRPVVPFEESLRDLWEDVQSADTDKTSQKHRAWPKAG